MGELKRQLSQNNDEKENVNSNGRNITEGSNVDSTAHKNESGSNYETLQCDYSQLVKKYDMAKRLCNLRNDDLSTLNKKNSELNEQLSEATTFGETMKVKYSRAKEICEMRMEKLNELRSQIADLEKKLEDRQSVTKETQGETVEN